MAKNDAMQPDQRRAFFALAAAVAFFCVAVLNLVSYLTLHERFQLWSAIGFALVSILWFIVSTRGRPPAHR
jgi:drug/metabolite transporter (DMT)-like permease